MAKINLRDYYPWYKRDCFIEVSDMVYKELSQARLREAAYYIRKYRNRAFYSLDFGDSIERDAITAVASAHDELVCKQAREQLYIAISQLSAKQAKRVYAHYFMGMGKSEIARLEGVNKSQITRSINKAIIQMKKFLR